MPDCSEQEAASYLADIAEVVAAAEWAVEQAEADVKYMELQDATADKWTKLMAWMYCLAGGDGSGNRAQAVAKEAKAVLREMKLRHLEEVRAYRDELVARAKELGAVK